MRQFLITFAFVSATVSPFTAFAGDVWNTKSTSIDPTQLPLGDAKYSALPKKGYIYPCDPDAYFSIPLGAKKTGSWIHGTTWDRTQKPFVHGSVSWPTAVFTIATTSESRRFRGNGMPIGIRTGVFPTQKDDPAFEYDGNPNAIKERVVDFSVPLDPSIAPKPTCLETQIGYTLDGVVMMFALSSLHAHDEIAYEMQDQCGGMAEPGGIYHRHALSSCIPHIKERNALVGYALDGFGIFSLYDSNGRELTTNDLDECHGTTTPIVWDGKKQSMYHYVLTRDYPYTIGCFRGTPTHLPLPSPPFSALIPSLIQRVWLYIQQFFQLLR